MAAARARGVAAVASASINHLTFNELDVGDYRTFYRLDPPLRAEADRQALIAALASGEVEIVTSAHTPQPPERKRLPFAEAAPGAVGLETLLPALLSLHHDGSVPLLTLLKAVTSAPADLLGLPCGRLARGAPADLILVDLDTPPPHRRGTPALKVEELAVRRAAGAGRGEADDGGRPGGAPGVGRPEPAHPGERRDPDRKSLRSEKRATSRSGAMSSGSRHSPGGAE